MTQTSDKLKRLVSTIEELQKAVDQEKLEIIRKFSEEFKEKYKLDTEYLVLPVYFYADQYPDYYEFVTLFYITADLKVVGYRRIYDRESSIIKENHHDMASVHIPVLENYQYEYFDESFLPCFLSDKLQNIVM